jgi:hypothetical protein
MAQTAEHKFVEFQQKYIAYVDSIADESVKLIPNAATKNIVLIRSKTTLNKLKKLWAAWDKHIDAIAKEAGAGFNLSYRYRSPAIVHKNIKLIETRVERSTRSRTHNKEETLAIVASHMARFERKANKRNATASEQEHCFTVIKQLDSIQTAIYTDESTQFKLRSDSGIALKAKLVRNDAESLPDVLSKHAKPTPADLTECDWAKVQAKRLGIFILDLEGKTRIVSLASAYDRNGDEIGHSKIHCWQSEGMRERIYRQDEVKHRPKFVVQKGGERLYRTAAQPG